MPKNIIFPKFDVFGPKNPQNEKAHPQKVPTAGYIVDTIKFCIKNHAESRPQIKISSSFAI